MGCNKTDLRQLSSPRDVTAKALKGFFGAALVCGTLSTRLVPAAVPTGIKLDGSIGGAAQVLAGPTYNITQGLGKLSTGNLFYSFQYFNIGTGNTALFTTTSSGINNVISRVTGGYTSTIDGTITLQAAYGSPNFFLINPAGVTFTSNASVNVPAAFYVSTANYLKFSDGNFYVDPTKISTLSAATPEAFGFLGTTRAAVNVEGANLSAGMNGAGDFQITAGDATIDGGGILSGIQNTTGNIRVTTVGSARAEVPLSGPFASTDGTVTIRNGGLLLTQGQGSSSGGAIDVDAGNLLIDGLGLAINGIGLRIFNIPIAVNIVQRQQTGINALSDSGGLGADGSGPITVTLGGDAKIVNGGAIVSETFGSGNAGNLSIKANSLTIDGESYGGTTGIVTETQAARNAGSTGTMTVMTTGALTVTNQGLIGSGTFGSGDGGAMILTATGPLTITNGSYVLCVALASGNAGPLTVSTTGALTITNEGEIASIALLGSGNAGALQVTAGSIDISGEDAPFLTGITSQTQPYSSGAAGTLTVTTPGALTMTNGGEISSSTFGSGNAGALSVTAASIVVETSAGIDSAAFPGSSGAGGTLTLNTTGALAVSNGGQIASGTFGSGNGGALKVTAGSIDITGTGQGGASALTGITSETEPGSKGNAGALTVTTPGALTITNGGEISSPTSGPGNAGALTVTAGSTAIDGGTSLAPTGINSSALKGSTGSAGSVTVDVTGTAYIADGGQIASAADKGSGGQPGTLAISAGALLLGTNGAVTIENDATLPNASLINPTQINIQARNLQMSGGLITAASTGDVAASGIDIHYHSALRMDSSTISTSAADGDGGAITINGQGPVLIDHSNITTSVVGTINGNGGDVAISVPEIVLDTGAIQANTAAARATGGNVTVNAGAILPSFQYVDLAGAPLEFNPELPGENLIQASAPDGVSGALNLTRPTLDIGSSLLGLTATPAPPTVLARNACGYTRGSSLTIAGRGGVPMSARDPLWIEPDGVSQETSENSQLSEKEVTLLAVNELVDSRKLVTCRQ